MLKKVDTSQLKVGMFIHDLDCGWMEHPFLRSRFRLASDEEIQDIRNAKIRTVVVDCNKGLDVDDAPTLDQAEAALESEVAAIAARPVMLQRVPVAEELQRAGQLRTQATSLVRTVMSDARFGKVVELDKVGPVVEGITASILRNSGAFISLLHIKNKDDYTFLHSVSVCALLVAFCSSRQMDQEMVYQAGLGGLLHDTGKAFVPDSILKKQGRLTDEEFAIIKRHPRDGYEFLLKTPEVSQVALDITLHHHERLDGSGYPDRQEKSEISELAQMAAIVDVYDAITSDRCYHKAVPAAEALRKIYEWSKFHFDPSLSQEFMRCVGIYPVGTLVLLESGRLGVVVQAHETSLLTPKVNVFFSTRNQAYIRPETIDLSKPFGKGGGDRIVRHESAQKWNLDPLPFMTMNA